MTDEELEHRLTAVENRAQSNTHRLDELGKLTDAVNGMNTNIKLTIQQLENTNKSLEIVTAQNKKQEDRLTALEKAPGTFGNKLWWAVIAALVSGLQRHSPSGTTELNYIPAGDPTRIAGGGFFVCLEVLHKGNVQSVEKLRIDNGIPYNLRLKRK